MDRFRAVGDAGPSIPSSGFRARLTSTAWSSPRADLVALAGLLLVLAYLWGRTRHSWYWLDEGFTLNIASRPLSEIPELLRQDGSPPFFYGLLHFWMKLAGSGEARTHLLSLLFAVGVIPAALWAGWSLFDRRTGWMFALLAALSPYLATYATETRMYSLVVLLSTLAIATFLHGFVFRRRGYIPAFVVLLTLVMYTHSWGLLLAAGTVVGVAICLVVGPDRRRLLFDAALAFGATALAFMPWFPTLLYQRAQGAPWLPGLTPGVVRDELFTLVGGREAVVVMGLGALPALVPMLRPPWSRQALALMAATAVPIVVVAAAWAASRGESIWGYRYLAVVVPSVLLVTAVGLARGGLPAVAALGVLVMLNLPLASSGPLWQKSNIRAVSEQFRSQLTAEDLVVADYSYLPLLSRYLAPGPKYISIAGAVADVGVADQRDTLRRHRENDPAAFLPPVIDSLPVGGNVLFACPTRRPLSYDVREFPHLVLARCDQVKALLAGDRRLRLASFVGAPPEALFTAAEAYFFTKQAG